MFHQMNLCDSPFKAIKSGYKTIEMRLYDERRKLINIGDTIEFTNLTTKETLTCLVKNLYRYNTFKELYSHHDKTTIGYKEDEKANPDDMLIYYTKEKIAKYGVVGIEIELCT